MIMKRIFTVILALALCFSVSACGRTDNGRSEEQAESLANEMQQDGMANESEGSAEEPAPGADDDETQTQEDTAQKEQQDGEDAAQDEQPAGEGSKGQAFDLEAGTVMLNSGYEMPILGIGTFRLSQSEAEDSVYWALRDGYRLIDTARIYGNEAGVGRGIRKAIEEGFVTREEIFVTTKMWTDDYGNGAAAIDASLERLGLDYIDDRVIIGTS